MWRLQVYKWMKGFDEGDVDKVLVVKFQDMTRGKYSESDKGSFSEHLCKKWILIWMKNELKIFNQSCGKCKYKTCPRKKYVKSGETEDRWRYNYKNYTLKTDCSAATRYVPLLLTRTMRTRERTGKRRGRRGGRSKGKGVGKGWSGNGRGYE